jgi:Mg/Co/Ni transporter MgtE
MQHKMIADHRTQGLKYKLHVALFPYSMLTAEERAARLDNIIGKGNIEKARAGLRSQNTEPPERQIDVINQMQPAAIDKILSELNTEDRNNILSMMNITKLAAMLIQTENTSRYLDNISEIRIQEIIGVMSEIDAAKLLPAMSRNTAARILERIGTVKAINILNKIEPRSERVYILDKIELSKSKKILKALDTKALADILSAAADWIQETVEHHKKDKAMKENIVWDESYYLDRGKIIEALAGMNHKEAAQVIEYAVPEDIAYALLKEMDPEMAERIFVAMLNTFHGEDAAARIINEMSINDALRFIKSGEIGINKRILAELDQAKVTEILSSIGLSEIEELLPENDLEQAMEIIPKIGSKLLLSIIMKAKKNTLEVINECLMLDQAVAIAKMIRGDRDMLVKYLSKITKADEVLQECLDNNILSHEQIADIIKIMGPRTAADTIGYLATTTYVKSSRYIYDDGEWEDDTESGWLPGTAIIIFAEMKKSEQKTIMRYMPKWQLKAMEYEIRLSKKARAAHKSHTTMWKVPSRVEMDFNGKDHAFRVR